MHEEDIVSNANNEALIKMAAGIKKVAWSGRCHENYQDEWIRNSTSRRTLESKNTEVSLRTWLTKENLLAKRI